MEQLKDLDILIGKTIERVVNLDREIYIFFADETFCIFYPIGGEYPSVEMFDYDYNTEPNIYNYKNLRELGLIDGDTFVKFNDMVERERNECAMQKELELLEKLRKKYPDA